MIRRLLVIAVCGVMVSGCFMAPLALIGPVSSGFSTASLIQSGVTSGANYMVKKSTGKTIAEHALGSLNSEILKQTYMPENEVSEKCRKYDFYCKRLINKDPSLMLLVPKTKVNADCKKYDLYCKRMSRKNSTPIDLPKSTR